MKAVILPTAKTADLAPLTSWLPEFLLPVVNKPIVEHLIELLADTFSIGKFNAFCLLHNNIGIHHNKTTV